MSAAFFLLLFFFAFFLSEKRKEEQGGLLLKQTSHYYRQNRSPTEEVEPYLIPLAYLRSATTPLLDSRLSHPDRFIYGQEVRESTSRVGTCEYRLTSRQTWATRYGRLPCLWLSREEF